LAGGAILVAWGIFAAYQTLTYSSETIGYLSEYVLPPHLIEFWSSVGPVGLSAWYVIFGIIMGIIVILGVIGGILLLLKR
jgi:hypothetical protein